MPEPGDDHFRGRGRNPKGRRRRNSLTGTPGDPSGGHPGTPGGAGGTPTGPRDPGRPRRPRSKSPPGRSRSPRRRRRGNKWKPSEDPTRRRERSPIANGTNTDSLNGHRNGASEGDRSSQLGEGTATSSNLGERLGARLGPQKDKKFKPLGRGKPRPQFDRKPKRKPDGKDSNEHISRDQREPGDSRDSRERDRESRDRERELREPNASSESQAPEGKRKTMFKFPRKPAQGELPRGPSKSLHRDPLQSSQQESSSPHNSTAPLAARPSVVLTYRKSSIYERVNQVGEGTYGKVFKVRNVETGRMAALKRLRMESEKDGLPITAVREIKLLQSIRHKSIVTLHEMVVEMGSIYMAFEYLDHDLAGLLANPDLELTPAHVKHIFLQMMEGLSYLHRKGILHRDIKGSNILVDNSGNIKLADFGLARSIDLSSLDAHYTNRVITLWYRPPELLLGATVYSGAIDVWGLGCLLVELFNSKPIFRAQDEISQLAAIFQVLGTPNAESWPGIAQLPWYNLLCPADMQSRESQFRQLYGELLKSAAAVDLAERLLQVDPGKRISAEDALKHEYFTEDPAPSQLDLSNIGEWHDFEAKKRRRKARPQPKAEVDSLPPPPPPEVD